MTDAPTPRTADTLARPLAVRGLTSRSRIAMAPMTRNFSPDGVPGRDVADYYTRCADPSVGRPRREGGWSRWGRSAGRFRVARPRQKLPLAISSPSLSYTVTSPFFDVFQSANAEASSFASPWFGPIRPPA